MQINEILDQVNKSSRAGLMKWVNVAMKTLFAYLAIVGIGSFALFIAQEQSQILTWSNFPAMDERRYDLVKMNLDSLEATTDFIRTVNFWWMWLCPPQKRSYEIYADGLRGYIETHKQIILAHEPKLYSGEQIAIKLNYKSIERKKGRIVLRARKLAVFVDSVPDTRPIEISGILRTNQSGAYIDIRSKQRSERPPG